MMQGFEASRRAVFSEKERLNGVGGADDQIRKGRIPAVRTFLWRRNRGCVSERGFAM